VKTKIEEAMAISQHTPPIDGETFVNNMIDRFVN
jgi:antitoxin ParD1/3/4